jgi:HEPN domain-containing protein
MGAGTQPSAFVQLVVFTQARTAWVDCAPNAAILAVTIYPIANVPNAAHFAANTYSPAAVRYVMCVGKHGKVPVRTHTSRAVTGRLATSLKLAVEKLERNIRKLEKAEISPLLIAARKKQLAKVQDELARLSSRNV